nr:ABC transporter ATP-binding protein/permease [Bacilli bacterium]
NNKLLTILNSDVYQVQQGVLILVRLIVRAPFMIIGALTISFLLDWRIGVVFASIVPLILLVIFLVMRKSSKEYVTIQGKLDRISNKTSDTINGIKVIKSLNRQEYENLQFEDRTSSYHKHAVRVNKINSLINPLTFAIISAATIIVVYIGGQSIINSTSDNGVLLATTLIAETSYLAQILFTLVQLANVILILTKSKVSRKRCDEILSITPSIVDNDSQSQKEISSGEEIISFNDVSFGYEKDGNFAIKDVSFSLKKGESLGIIGGTGSGKSTLISLIERFVDASKGEVIYKGDNIKDYSLTALRDEIALVSQKSVLFKGTIRSNMLIAKADATDEEIVSALKAAEAYEFVSKYDDFLDHEVVENGMNFSGGQRQRLCIARAILKCKEIVILDDSTSALDLLTDKRVRENISKINGISKIIVSQRVATVSNCDQILVFEGGELLAKGSHEHLLKNSDVYKETYESQIKKEGE